MHSLPPSRSRDEPMPQITLSMIDLELHAAKGDAKEPGWSTRLHADVVAPLQPIPQPDGSVSHSTFGHLGNYGANYYSYLWCRGISALVWRALFVDDPLREGAGDKLVDLFRELTVDRKSEIANLELPKAHTLTQPSPPHHSLPFRASLPAVKHGGAKDPELIFRDLAQLSFGDQGSEGADDWTSEVCRQLIDEINS
jgi:hypothetical protein